MSPLHQLYFNVVLKLILPKKEKCTEVNFLDLTLMEILDTQVKIDLSKLIIKHMQRTLIKDVVEHSLPYEFWLDPVFEDYLVPVHVWLLQTTKNVIGKVEHMALYVAVMSADIPLQCSRNALTENNSAINTAQLSQLRMKIKSRDHCFRLKLILFRLNLLASELKM